MRWFGPRSDNAEKRHLVGPEAHARDMWRLGVFGFFEDNMYEREAAEDLLRLLEILAPSLDEIEIVGSLHSLVKPSNVSLRKRERKKNARERKRERDSLSQKERGKK